MFRDRDRESKDRQTETHRDRERDIQEESLIHSMAVGAN